MKKWHILLLLAIVALGAFLRFYQITEIPPGLYPDEAMNGNNALEAIATGHFKIFYPENNGREGLFINLQALSLAIFGNEPWVLRIVSALMGTLTIFGVYLVTKESFTKKTAIPAQAGIQKIKSWIPDRVGNDRWIALLAAFFLATSYWHVNFSRIGFRAILVPFFATFAMYFLLKGLRRGRTLNLVWAGIFAGLGFHTYIAFRFMALVFAVPIGWHLWRWYRETQNSIADPIGDKTQNHNAKLKTVISCIPCAILLFLFVASVAALPLGVHFLKHTEDFIGRSGQVSIFSAGAPLRELSKSALQTAAMFFISGDCNWRHNFNCQPQLHPLLAALLIAGVFAIATRRGLIGLTLAVWLVAMSLPAILTAEGLPHALRSIGMIPPVMILAAIGATASWDYLSRWLTLQQDKWPGYAAQLRRIRKEIIILVVLALLTVPFLTYRAYFLRWAAHPETYAAFSVDLLHIGQFLNSLPLDAKKYVVVNLPGVDVRGIPMPAQTVMFATDTFGEEERVRKNIVYLVADDINNQLLITNDQKVTITLLNGSNPLLIRQLQRKFPELKVSAPGNFVVLQNY